GPELAGQASPETLRFPQGKRAGATLTLTVASAHALAIQHREPAIIERVNRHFGYAAVARVALRQGRPVPVQTRETPEAKPTNVPDEDRRQLREITDDDLRGSLEALAARVAATTGPPKIS
ncbi:MAG: DciA family protein, partial [Pacificimonas sp.]